LSKSLIKKLQECSTLGQADPILTKLGAGHAVKKLVETAIILNNSQDLAQRSHAFSFMESAIKELEDDDLTKDKLHEEEDKKDDKDNKKENKITEEELSNLNNGPREKGSEQSTDNTPPYPGEGKDTENGAKDMHKMEGTENQFNETGLTPPGLDPDIVKELGQDVKFPPMNDKQTIQQMQYTVKELYRNHIIPLNKLVQKQGETISNLTKSHRVLEQKIQETKGSMTLDIDQLRQNATATFRTQETTGIAQPFDNPHVPPTYLVKNKAQELAEARAEIDAMDKILKSGNKSIYG